MRLYAVKTLYNIEIEFYCYANACESLCARMKKVQVLNFCHFNFNLKKIEKTVKTVI